MFKALMVLISELRSERQNYFTAGAVSETVANALHHALVTLHFAFIEIPK